MAQDTIFPPELEATSLPPVPENSVPETEQDEDDELEYDAKARIPKLPIREKDLPPIIRENVQVAPHNRKHAVMMAILPMLCVLATRVRLKYPFDKRLHALLLQVLVEAPPSTGKGFTDNLVTQIIDPTLTAHDDAERLKEQLYREKKASRKANETIGDPPKTTIRCLPATTSKTSLNKRADLYKRNLGDYTSFWMYAEELAQLTEAGKQSYSNLRTIMRVAYDLGSKFGQDFASDSSYSAVSDINICSLFCATPNDVDDFMDKRSILGGNVTRNILIQLDDELGSDPAEFKDFTEDQERMVNDMLQTLMADCYSPEGALQPIILLDMKWLEKDIRRWCRKKAEEALKSGNKALDVFRKRSSVSAFRSAALCYYLYLLGYGIDIHKFCNGQVTLPENDLLIIQRLTRKLYRYFCESILSAMMGRWGAKYNELNKKRSDGVDIKPNERLIDQLTAVFTRQQLDLLIKENGNETESRFFLSQWKAKGWIEKIAKNQYRKLI